jgi:hypothetical protein
MTSKPIAKTAPDLVKSGDLGSAKVSGSHVKSQGSSAKNPHVFFWGVLFKLYL